MYEKKLEEKLDIQGRFSEVCTNACLAKTAYTLHKQSLYRKNIAHKLIHYVGWEELYVHFLWVFSSWAFENRTSAEQAALDTNKDHVSTNISIYYPIKMHHFVHL